MGGVIVIVLRRRVTNWRREGRIHAMAYSRNWGTKVWTTHYGEASETTSFAIGSVVWGDDTRVIRALRVDSTELSDP